MAGFGPSDVGMVLQGVGALAQAIAIFAAAWLASNTFEGWRRQKLSERRIEQAERILTATYKVRRGLSSVRNPTIWGHELFAAEEKLRSNRIWPEEYNQQERKKIQQVYYSRLHSTLDSRLELEACQPMARSLFGSELEIAIEELNRQFHIVRVYVDAAERDPRGANQKFREKIDAAIYEGHPYDAPNEMDETVKAQVKLIEDILIPVLRLNES